MDLIVNLSKISNLLCDRSVYIIANLYGIFPLFIGHKAGVGLTQACLIEIV